MLNNFLKFFLLRHLTTLFKVLLIYLQIESLRFRQVNLTSESRIAGTWNKKCLKYCIRPKKFPMHLEEKEGEFSTYAGFDSISELDLGSSRAFKEDCNFKLLPILCAAKNRNRIGLWGPEAFSRKKHLIGLLSV